VIEKLTLSEIFALFGQVGDQRQVFQEEPVVEAIAHALVRTPYQVSGGTVRNRAMASTDGTK
jgi:hypothetical protein